MVQTDMVNEVKNRLVKTYNPLAIYIFGSYAWGSPTDDSDLDLLVVIDASDEKSFKRPVSGHMALRDLDVSKDIIVYTKEEFDRASADTTTFVSKIVRDGKLIYARA